MSPALLANRDTGKKKRHRPWFGADGATVRLSAHSLVPCPPGSTLRIRDRTYRRNRTRRCWSGTYTIRSRRGELRRRTLLSRDRLPDRRPSNWVHLWECRRAILCDIQYEAGLNIPAAEANHAARTLDSGDASGCYASRCCPRVQTIIPDATWNVFSNCVRSNRHCKLLRRVAK